MLAMPDFRKAIRAELRRRKWSKYQLVKALKGARADGRDVTATTVYEFLAGKSSINSDDLGLILDVLELSLTGKNNE